MEIGRHWSPPTGRSSTAGERALRGAAAARGRRVAVALVVMLGLSFSSGTVTVSAASVASTGTVSNSVDKVRCSLKYSASGATTVRMRCYFDTWTTWNTAFAGQDLTSTGNTAPYYQLMPTGTGCTLAYPVDTAIGPQTSAQSLSGAPIPAYGLETTYSVTGASCNMAISTLWQVRIYVPPSTDKNASCSGAGNCNVVTGTGWENWPANWYPAGSGAVSALCPGFSATGPNANVIQAGEAQLSFTWTINLAYPVESVEYRFTNITGSVWASFVSAYYIFPTSTKVLTFPASMSGKTLVQAGLQFRCIAPVDGVRVFSYGMYGSSFESTEAPPTACRALTLTWPPNKTYTVGELMPFYFKAGFLAAPLDLQWRSRSPVDATLSAWASTTQTKDAGGAVLGSPVSMTPMTNAQTGWFSITAAYEGTRRQIQFRCNDPDGEWLMGGAFTAPADVGVSSGGGGGSSGSFGDDCWGSIDVGANPSSWVPGLLGGMKCVAYDLFVPSPEELAEALAKFEALQERPPLQWVVEGTDYVSAASLSFATWASSWPACVNVMDTEVCPRTWDTGTAGLPSWLTGALLFGLWSAVIFTVWRFF